MDFVFDVLLFARRRGPMGILKRSRRSLATHGKGDWALLSQASVFPPNFNSFNEPAQQNLAVPPNAARFGF